MSHARFLRESAIATEIDIELRAITDPAIPSLLPGGSGLIEFATATVLRDPDRIATARHRLDETLGTVAVVDAAATIGNFEMMNRIADATGMPVGKGSKRANADLIKLLDIADMEH